MKRLLVPLLTLTILGAGCASEPAPAPQPVTPPSAPSPAPAPQPSPSPTPISEPAPVPPAAPETPPTSESSSLTPATTDATWTTYTSTALGFSFQAPTKGRYAPQWEVKILKETDASVSGGCYAVSGGSVNEPKHVTVGSQAFCHTSAQEGAAGSTYFTDAYTTTLGHSVAVILFTKQVTNGGIIPGCSAQYSSVSTSCLPFTVADYQAALDGIVGTFTLTAK